jgi:hypothetical protein
MHQEHECHFRLEFNLILLHFTRAASAAVPLPKIKIVYSETLLLNRARAPVRGGQLSGDQLVLLLLCSFSVFDESATGASE